MPDDKNGMSGAGLGRWLLVLVVIVAGIVLFFVFGPSTAPTITPAVNDVLQ